MISALPPPILSLPQDDDTPAHRDLAAGPAGTYVAFTYVYARSRDTREAQFSGQDFIAYRHDPERIVFAVCDGVSQSFFGDLAARFLGTRLVEWLWTADSSDAATFRSTLDDRLREWPTEASALVEAKTFRADLPEMQRIALERKRTNGSESMFVAGQIDRTANRLALCWLGDMRLHLWTADGTPVAIPEAVWETRERWSTRLGPKNGSARGCVLPLTEIQRITAHSDGVGHFADSFSRLAQDQLDPMIAELQQAPTSDDASVLDIDLNVPALYGPFQALATPQAISIEIDSDGLSLCWPAVSFAARYRLCIDDGQALTMRIVSGLSGLQSSEATRMRYRLPASLSVTDRPLHCTVQAINDYALPSDWSAPLLLTVNGHMASAVAPLPILTPPETTAPPAAFPLTRPRRRRARAFVILLVSALVIGIITMVAWIGASAGDWSGVISHLVGSS